jgi:hypothetical protein
MAGAEQTPAQAIVAIKLPINNSIRFTVDPPAVPPRRKRWERIRTNHATCSFWRGSKNL